MIPYIPNEYQNILQDTQHNRNIILKARQIWFSTDIEIQWLDFALKNPGVNVGIIAHDKQSAIDIFRDKLKVARDNLPKNIKDRYTVSTENVRELGLTHKETGLTSYVTVATSFRWWTIQYIHISEFGRICAKYPAKAREIVTWAMEALGPNGMLFIESTAEGNEWYFYDFFTLAENNRQEWKELTQLDMKPYFFAWWENKAYSLPESDSVIVTREDMNYFRAIEERCQIRISLWQKKRYIKKKQIQQDDMGREYPSFIDEAFNLAVEWAYYKYQLEDMRKQGRICDLPYDKDKPVYAVRDLWGFWWWDDMAIIFYQKVGEWIHIIDAEEATGYSMEWFQTEFVQPRGYNIIEDWFPHDGKRTESNWKSVSQNAREIGIPVRQLPIGRITDWINEVKRLFHKIKIDEKNCAWLIKSLTNYRRERDQKRWMFADKPMHNRASHWCFAADTLIETNLWPKKIIDINVWDLVLTSVWYKNVTARIHKWKQEIYNLDWLYWTAWHKIKTIDWEKELANIKKTDSISYLSGNYIHKCRVLFTKARSITFIKTKRLATGERHTNYINEKDITDVLIDLKHYINKNGKILMDQSLNENKYIMWILIRLIMILTTLYVWLERYTENYTQNTIKKTKLLWKNYVHQQIMQENLQISGIEVKSDVNGTKSIIKSLNTYYMRKLKGFARFVEKNIWLTIKAVIRSVITTVSQHFVKPAVSTILRLFVIGADKLIQKTNIVQRNFALSHVLPKTTGRIENVYNLTIADVHEYYAWWILVGNSDAFRYLAVSYQTAVNIDNVIERNMNIKVRKGKRKYKVL